MAIVLGLKSKEDSDGARIHVSKIIGSNSPVSECRQCKLGTIIIQTVYVLQYDSAVTGSLPVENFFKHNPNYFQITQPGTSTVPPYLCRFRFSLVNLRQQVAKIGFPPSLDETRRTQGTQNSGEQQSMNRASSS